MEAINQTIIITAIIWISVTVWFIHKRMEEILEEIKKLNSNKK